MYNNTILRKKRFNRFLKDLRPFRPKGVSFYRWRKKLAIIHPCADDLPLLRKNGSSSESCIGVDGYFITGNAFVFFQVISDRMRYDKTGVFVSYHVPTHDVTVNHWRSIKWIEHHFTFYIRGNTVKTSDVLFAVQYIDHWIRMGEI